MRFIEINVMSGVRLSRAYMPGMVKREVGPGDFPLLRVGVEHPGQHDPLRRHQNRHAGPVARLAKRMAGTGVTVNSILPGPTLSVGLAGELKETIEKTGQAIGGGCDGFCAEEPAVLDHPPGGDRREVANLVVYTASPQASATTGAALRVDGGVVEPLRDPGSYREEERVTGGLEPFRGRCTPKDHESLLAEDGGQLPSILEVLEEWRKRVDGWPKSL